MSNFAEDYIPVNERIAAFYAKHPDGSLQSEVIELSDTRVTIRGLAYRSPDDPRPGIGLSSLEIPGKTPYTRGSEVENCETSAWGRAIAALGFEVKRGVASAEEVRSKSDDTPVSSGRAAPPPPARPSAPTTPPDLEDPTLDAPPVWEDARPRQTAPAPSGGVMWSKALFEAAEAAGIDKRAISDTSKRLFGKDKWKVTDLTDGERWTLAYELGLVAA
jgi:hypothetical protein